MPDQLVQKVIDEWGQVDILVNNAGYTLDAPIHKMSDEWFQRMLDIHSIVPFRMCRAVAPHMREPAKQEREAGQEVFRKIVNVSSISGTMGNAGQANYSSGKSAVVGLTKTLAKEWGQFKINVNAVAFGYIETRLTASKEESNTMEIDGEKVQLGIPDQLRGMAPMLIPLGRPGSPAGGRGRRVPALHAVGELHPRPGAEHHRRPVQRHDVASTASRLPVARLRRHGRRAIRRNARPLIGAVPTTLVASAGRCPPPRAALAAPRARRAPAPRSCACARRLFSERNYDAVSTSEIAQAGRRRPRAAPPLLRHQA